MAPKVKLTAALFQERYGNLVSEHFAQYTTAYTLRVALSKRNLVTLRQKVLFIFVDLCSKN